MNYEEEIRKLQMQINDLRTRANSLYLKRSMGDYDTFTAKTTLANNDLALIEDSAESFTKKKVTWTNIKATLKTYFDTLYAVAAKGVTNGDNHDHIGGDGATIKGKYVSVATQYLTDSAGNTWSGAGRNTGTYTFRPADNGNIWPTTATAVAILIGGKWTSANNTYLMNARRSSGGDNEGQIRALVASMMLTVQVIQTTDANGYFYINISGANMNASVVRIVGYFV